MLLVCMLDSQPGIFRSQNLEALGKVKEIFIKRLESHEILIETWKFQCNITIDHLRENELEKSPKVIWISREK